MGEPAWGRLLLVSGAVAAGAAVTFGLVLAFTWLALAATGLGMADSPTPAYLTLNLVGSFVAPVLGGGVATSLARATLPAWILAGLLLLLSAGSLGRPLPGQPGWYPAAIALLGVGGALVGGLWVAARQGTRSDARLRRRGRAAG